MRFELDAPGIQTQEVLQERTKVITSRAKVEAARIVFLMLMWRTKRKRILQLNAWEKRKKGLTMQTMALNLIQGDGVDVTFSCIFRLVSVLNFRIQNFKQVPLDTTEAFEFSCACRLT